MISRNLFAALIIVAIASAPLSANAAPPKKKLPMPFREPPALPQPPKASAPPTRLVGCGEVWSNESNTPLYKALSASDEPKSFAWKRPRDKVTPANSVVEVRIQFDGNVEYDVTTNPKEWEPEVKRNDGDDIIAHVEEVQMSWNTCKIDSKGMIVLTDKDTNEVRRFKPTLDAKKKTVLSLTSEKDGLILKPAEPRYPAPSL